MTKDLPIIGNPVDEQRQTKTTWHLQVAEIPARALHAAQAMPAPHHPSQLHQPFFGYSVLDVCVGVTNRIYKQDRTYLSQKKVVLHAQIVNH